MIKSQEAEITSLQGGSSKISSLEDENDRLKKELEAAK